MVDKKPLSRCPPAGTNKLQTSQGSRKGEFNLLPLSHFLSEHWHLLLLVLDVTPPSVLGQLTWTGPIQKAQRPHSRPEGPQTSSL